MGTMEPDLKISDGDDLVKRFSDQIRNKNLMITSEIPNVCRNEPCLLGVDEAGRGPVLGPMVYGISFCPLSKSEELSTLGCADSKVLTEKKREDIFSVLCACDDYVGWSVDIISPNCISNNMLKRTKHSLNEVAQDSTVKLIQRVIQLGVQVAEIYVDTVGPPEKYQDKLSKFFPNCQVTVAKKADSLYPIVSAASICAKVTRDRVIDNWKFSEDIDVVNKSYGSGYPGDPDTKNFLTSQIDQIFGFPNIVRFSWSTASKLLEANAVQVEWDEEEECDTPTIKSFFSSSLSKPVMKHSFFKDRNLSTVTHF